MGTQYLVKVGVAVVETPIVSALVGWIRARPSYAIDANTGELGTVSHFVSMGRVVNSLAFKSRLPHCRPFTHGSLERSLPAQTTVEFRSHG